MFQFDQCQVYLNYGLFLDNHVVLSFGTVVWVPKYTLVNLSECTSVVLVCDYCQVYCIEHNVHSDVLGDGIEVWEPEPPLINLSVLLICRAQHQGKLVRLGQRRSSLADSYAICLLFRRTSVRAPSQELKVYFIISSSVH